MSRTYGLFLVFIFQFQIVVAQDIRGLEKLEEQLSTYRAELPTEKVYLHFDKPYYYSGEDLWFQVYLVAGPGHQPSPLSKVIYVELISPEGLVLKRIKLPVEDGVAKGDFQIPAFLQSSTYRIRAYTNWMRNFDEDLMFSKNIVIIRPYDGEAPVAGDKLPLKADFYPEGGDLVEGLESKIAIKLSGNPFQTQAVKVEVFDANDKSMGSTITNKDGIGTIKLTPIGQGYYARLDDDTRHFPLPMAKEQGYNLSIDHFTNPEQIIVNVGASFKDKKRRRGHVVAQSRGVLLYSADVAFVGKIIQTQIPKSVLWTGVIHITFFDENWQPEAERLMFHDSGDALNVTISTNQAVYEPRDSTIVSIKVTDRNQKPVQGTFSMSVLDSAQVSASLSTENIKSNLLLTSDIKGYVHNPGRFFGEYQHDHLRRELDLILLTHGWRRFIWTETPNSKPEQDKYPIEGGITVKGKLFAKKNKTEAMRGTVAHVGSLDDGTPSLATAESDENGVFELKGLRFYEQEENFLEGRDRKRRKGHVTIDSTWQTYPELNVKPLLYNELDTIFIKDHIEKSKERQYLKSLNEVNEGVRDLGQFVVEGTRKTREGREVFQYDFDEQIVFSQYASLFQMIGRNIIQGVRVEGSPHYRRAYSQGFKVENYMIDGVIFSDSTQGRIKSIPAWAVKRVLGGVPGFIAVEMRDEGELLDFYRAVGDKRVSVLPGGYYKSREYFSPRYFPAKPEHDIPDNRDLIHWQPLISTNENGEARVTYFNADLETTVLINLEGFSTLGTLGVASKSYRVLKK